MTAVPLEYKTSSNVAPIDYRVRSGVEELMSDYVRALDECRLDDWVGCFGEKAAYSVIPRSNVVRGLKLCIMADGTKARIRDRVLFITKIWRDNYTDYIPRHIHALLSVRPTKDGEGHEAISNFAAYGTEPNGHSLLLGVGEYRDLIVEEGGRFCFRSRQVILDTEILPRYLVYPL